MNGLNFDADFTPVMAAGFRGFCETSMSRGIAIHVVYANRHETPLSLKFVENLRTEFSCKLDQLRKDDSVGLKKRHSESWGKGNAKDAKLFNNAVNPPTSNKIRNEKFVRARIRTWRMSTASHNFKRTPVFTPSPCVHTTIQIYLWR